ncbi:MAG: cytochrome c oxidase subunit II [Rhodobiaceae bacterium]|jgi:cytochrome c oxidase subunit 2|nr:cytochrome c oxidase subunit II [Rhodobiaceae bacterium]MBT5641022.1 cytochrome c oxidase subunit II [Rhodobiaceae bacterium]MBT6223742.1 cytochrome c oxidase subunit II [Rhodobiaceae bacterium]
MKYLNMISLIKYFTTFTLIAFFNTSSVWAVEILGIPKDFQINFQNAATSNMEDIVWFHNWFLFPIITAITLFVMFLLIYVVFRYNAKRNPVPSRTTHNTLIEVMWTVLPILILAIIAVPSFRILYTQQTIPQNADMTIKVTGYQWYWGYEYPDHSDIAFDSLPLEGSELTDDKIRLLSVDNPLVVPANKIVRVQVTGGDVIHNWAMPSFGIKTDAVPGRLNETWFKVEEPGIYYGQCSELCGMRHAFMPIEVHVLAEEDFNIWLQKAKIEFTDLGYTTMQSKEYAELD